MTRDSAAAAAAAAAAQTAADREDAAAAAAAAEAAAAAAAAAAGGFPLPPPPLPGADPIAALTTLVNTSFQQFAATLQQQRQEFTALTTVVQGLQQQRDTPPPATFFASALAQEVFDCEATARHELGVPNGEFPANLLVATFPTDAAATAWIRTRRTELGLLTREPVTAPTPPPQSQLPLPPAPLNDFTHDGIEEGAEYTTYTAGNYIPLIPLSAGHGLSGSAQHEGRILHTVVVNGERIVSLCNDFAQDLNAVDEDTVSASDVVNHLLVLKEEIINTLVNVAGARFDILTLGARASTAAAKDAIMSAGTTHAFGTAADGAPLLTGHMRGFSANIATAHQHQAVRSLITSTRSTPPAPLPGAAPKPAGGGGRGGGAGGGGAGGGGRGGGGGGRGGGAAGGAAY